MTVVESVAASLGSAPWAEVQAPFASVSTTGWSKPALSLNSPTATQKPALGHDTARQGWLLPQFCDPNQNPWLPPVPAFDGSGAWVSVQLVPFCVSITPQGRVPVS